MTKKLWYTCDKRMALLEIFPEVVYQDNLPIKTYSEGMSARLMFSLLTYKNHECLALDEGLGTGDREFYDKAQVRLNDFLDSSGSLFIASHSTELLRRFCLRGIVFSGGNLIFDGNIEEALDFYEKYHS